MQPDPILTIKNLEVSFDEEPVLKNISLELNRGENMAVIGPNGAGKTVFLRALLGTVPYHGEITWAKDARIGYVPQKIDADRHLPVNFRNLLTAKANVLGKRGTGDLGQGTWDMRHETGDLGQGTWDMDKGPVTSNRGLVAGSWQPEAAISRVVNTVGLNSKILETPVGHLSGGQFQRALIAFALLGNPDVLIFDEPTASIDEAGERQIYDLVHQLQEDRGITVILVSHDLGFVYEYATQVLCINQSGLCFGPPDEMLTPEVLAKLYGGKAKHVHHRH